MSLTALGSGAWLAVGGPTPLVWKAVAQTAGVVEKLPGLVATDRNTPRPVSHTMSSNMDHASRWHARLLPTKRVRPMQTRFL